jgi:hypothetical protein
MGSGSASTTARPVALCGCRAERTPGSRAGSLGVRKGNSSHTNSVARASTSSPSLLSGAPSTSQPARHRAPFNRRATTAPLGRCRWLLSIGSVPQIFGVQKGFGVDRTADAEWDLSIRATHIGSRSHRVGGRDVVGRRLLRWRRSLRRPAAARSSLHKGVDPFAAADRDSHDRASPSGRRWGLRPGQLDLRL